MIVDGSAIVEILKVGPEAGPFLRKLASSPSSRMSAGGYIEICAVIVRSRIPHGFENFDQLVVDYRLQVAPVDHKQAIIARDAYRKFGRGSGDRAALNFGDCFAYALAKSTGEPLLFKGNDFPQTDLVAA